MHTAKVWHAFLAPLATKPHCCWCKREFNIQRTLCSPPDLSPPASSAGCWLAGWMPKPSASCT